MNKTVYIAAITIYLFLLLLLILIIGSLGPTTLLGHHNMAPMYSNKSVFSICNEK